MQYATATSSFRLHSVFFYLWSMLDVYFHFIFTIIFHNVLFHVMFLDLKFACIACRVTSWGSRFTGFGFSLHVSLRYPCGSRKKWKSSTFPKCSFNASLGLFGMWHCLFAGLIYPESFLKVVTGFFMKLFFLKNDVISSRTHRYWE